MCYGDSLMSKKIKILTILYVTIFVSFIFLLLYFTCGVFYLTNDDVGFMRTYSGYDTGVPSIGNSYGSYTFGLICVLLYTNLPGINWYTIISILVLIITNAVIFLKQSHEIDFKIAF